MKPEKEPFKKILHSFLKREIDGFWKKNKINEVKTSSKTSDNHKLRLFILIRTSGNLKDVCVYSVLFRDDE